MSLRGHTRKAKEAHARPVVPRSNVATHCNLIARLEPRPTDILVQAPYVRSFSMDCTWGYIDIRYGDTRGHASTATSTCPLQASVIGGLTPVTRAQNQCRQRQAGPLDLKQPLPREVLEYGPGRVTSGILRLPMAWVRNGPWLTAP